MLAIYPHAEQPERAVRPQQERRDLQHLEGVPKHGVRVARRVGAEWSCTAASLGRLAGVRATLHPQDLVTTRRLWRERKPGVVSGGQWLSDDRCTRKLCVRNWWLRVALAWLHATFAAWLFEKSVAV